MTTAMSQTGVGTDAKDVVMRFIEALNDDGKTTSVLERFSRSEVLTRKIMAYRQDYPELMIHPLDVFSERDLVVVRFLVDLEARLPNGPGTADLPPEVLEAIAVCRVEGGAITELWFEMDLFAQVLALTGDDEEHQAGVVAATPAGMPAATPAADPTARQFPDQALGDPHADTGASRSVVLRYLAALNNQLKTPALIERFATDKALTEHVMAFEAGFPGYNLLADEIIADGDRVAVRLHTRQRHAQEFMGIPATGLELSITGIVIYLVVGGMITKHWLQADTWTLMQRLQDGTGTLTKRQFLDRRVRGSEEHRGAERRLEPTVPGTT